MFFQRQFGNASYELSVCARAVPAAPSRPYTSGQEPRGALVPVASGQNRCLKEAVAALGRNVWNKSKQGGENQTNDSI